MSPKKENCTDGVSDQKAGRSGERAAAGDPGSPTNGTPEHGTVKKAVAVSDLPY